MKPTFTIKRPALSRHVLSRAAAALALGSAALTAQAGAPVQAHGMAEPVATATDRLIVKYKDAAPATKGAAHVPPIVQERLAALTRAGQQFGLRMQQLRTTATGAHVIQLDRKLAGKDLAALAQDLMARDAAV